MRRAKGQIRDSKEQYRDAGKRDSSERRAKSKSKKRANT
ncbi:hypothetical protein VCRA2113O324_120143 [Vibrio crassostreae]|nr:hypothetical protein VCRA2113O324_120143 [Vibrio crassostreae]CAK2221081.1 hypothetical protein VCRA2113O322_80142 [Vibrio crassostreae]CAK2614027.1 hypothetical protein VCRA2121O336_120150 [Vibrio crassostreae]CAK3083750.1 hypothetical protein VCRA2113O325_80053 [Vibrio crassostreae]